MSKRRKLDGGSALVPRRARKRRRSRAALGDGFMRPAGFFMRFPMSSDELRFLDTNATEADVTTAGVIAEDSLCHVAAGTGESDRIGRKITIKSVHVKGLAHLDSSTLLNDMDCWLRVIVYQDKHANGATAGVTDILEGANILAYRNLVNSERFNVLKDLMVNINTTAVSGDGTTHASVEREAFFQIHKKVNIPVQFSSTTGAISEIQNNNVGLLFIVSNANVDVTYRCRVRFREN